MQLEIFFRATIFLYGPCPNLDGIKDMLCNEFRGPQLVRIAVLCAQTGVAIELDAFSNKKARAQRVSRGLLSRPPSLKQNERRGLFFDIV